jgi:hypothetical protein
VLAACFKNWATKADGFGHILAIAATRPAFTIWVKEHLGGQLTAGTLLLPIPVFNNWFR